MFAFGILLQRLFTEGEDPYQQFLGAQDRVARIREFVVSGQRPGPDPRVPHAVRRLVLECLQDAPRSRPSFVDVRYRPWLYRSFFLAADSKRARSDRSPGAS